MRRFLALSLLLAGCAVGPNFERPKAPTARWDARDPTGVQRFDRDAEVTGDWWRMFQSPALDAVVARAVERSASLEAARATLRRSQYAMRAGYGAFFPQVDAQAGGGYQQMSPLRFGQNQPATDFSLYTLQGSVTYLIDIWGGQRRQVESLRAQVDAERWTLAGARVVLCGNVADALIASAGYRAQVDALRAVADLEREQLRITEAQATGGTVPYGNVLAIRAQLAATEAQIPALAQKADQADDLVAMLAGEAPGVWSPPSIALGDFTLPADVPLSLPSKLVRQRADVLVAEALLHSANAQIGVATAAMLPNLTLGATAGANNTSLGDLFAPNALFGSIGPGITAPVFHGGTLWYQRKAAVAARDAAFATYRQTVLAAFEQVADTLRALEHDGEAVRAEKDALDAASDSLRLVQTNYRAGVANYLQVIVANEQWAQAKIGWVQAVTQRLQDTVALYVALGGGWWNVRSL